MSSPPACPAASGGGWGIEESVRPEMDLEAVQRAWRVTGGFALRSEWTPGNA
jgi:hypothetical protein